MLDDLRFAIRTLAKAPGFAAVAALVLALGIAANTAVFSALNFLLIRPLPYQDAGRLVMLGERNPAKGLGGAASIPNWNDWREQARSFESMAAFRDAQPFQLAAGGETVSGARVSANFFGVLGVKPMLGRTFAEGDDAPGAPDVAVVSEPFWRQHLGADPGAAGSALLLDNRKVMVAGVLPAGFRLLYRNDGIWVPLPRGLDAAARGERSVQVIGRLKPGIALATARAEMNTISRRLEQQYPEANAGWQAWMKSMRDYLIGPRRPILLVLLVTVSLVLLIACLNIAGLQMARAAARQKEVALRLALGGTRFRIVRQMLAEALLLAVASGALGLLLIAWIRSAAMAAVPELRQFVIDGNVCLFTLLVSTLSGMAFALTPALDASRPDLNEMLKSGARDSTMHGSSRRRGFFVAGQMAVAVVLLVGAGLLIESFGRLTAADPCFRTENILVAELALPEARYNTAAQRVAFSARVLERARALPGVQSAAAATSMPLFGAVPVALEAEGRPAQDAVSGGYRAVTPEYFQLYGIALREGRPFTAEDRAGAPAVAIANQCLAGRLWPRADPVGKRVKLAADRWATVVGVSANVRSVGLRAPAAPEIFVPYAQDPTRALALALRTANDPLRFVTAVRAEIRALDRDVPVAYANSMEKLLGEQTALVKYLSAFTSSFACLALALASIGLYGLIAFLAAQRKREIGIRMALGATQADVLRLVLRSGLRLAGAGLVLGTLGGLALARVLSGVLFGVEGANLRVFVTVALVLTAVALSATWFPARRAATVDPAAAIRNE